MTSTPTTAEGSEHGVAPRFQDEPAAHALFDQMIEAIQRPDSLSYVSHYWWEAKGEVLGDCSYRAWLRKPNYFRVEAKPTEGEGGGVLIGDGDDLWIHWPQGRLKWDFEDQEVYEKTRFNSYMTKPAPLGKHSIGHQAFLLGARMTLPIINPSTFHGRPHVFQPYLDGVKSLGTETLGDEECDKIEVSIMGGQRSWHLWLSRHDRLPRKLKEVIRVHYDITIHEEWSSVTLNADIPETMFAWKPPEDWTEWKLPPSAEDLLKPGTKAPDFDLASVDGKRIKLSDYRGQVVWFYNWRAG